MQITFIEGKNLLEKIRVGFTELQNELTLIDFAHTITLFFRINGKILKSKGLNFKVSIFKFYKPLHEKKSRTILKRLLVTFLGMSYLILKRSSLRKV